MKNFIIAAFLSGWGSIAVGTELPVQVVDGLLIEVAWAIAHPDGVEVFLVINNRSTII